MKQRCLAMCIGAILAAVLVPAANVQLVITDGPTEGLVSMTPRLPLP